MVAEPLEPMGFDILEVPFIWLPDDCDGPRPGYPWFEAGRMMLSAEQLDAWPPADPSRRSGQARSADQGEAVADQLAAPPDQQTMQRQAFGDAPEQVVMGSRPAEIGVEITAAAEARFARYSPSEVAVAIEAWNAVSDPRITLAALDAASAANPIVRSLAHTATSYTCPPEKAAFFTNLSIYQDMARRLNTNVDFIMALSSHESAWSGPHAQELHNLFGVTRAGANNLQWDSYEAAADYWGAHYGQYVQGARTMDDFIAGLRQAGYNSRDAEYDNKLRRTLGTLHRYRQACGIE